MSRLHADFLIFLLAICMSCVAPASESDTQPAGSTGSGLNRILSVSVLDTDPEIRVRVEYSLEGRHGGKARVSLLAVEQGSGKYLLHGSALDDGTGSAEIIIRRRPGLHYPVDVEYLWVRLLATGEPLLAETKLYRPIQWLAEKDGAADKERQPELYQVAARVNKLFKNEEFAALDRLCEAWKSGTQRLIDGGWQLEGFRPVPGYGLEDGWWERNNRILQNWRSFHAQSECAAIMQAEAWVEYARQFRGIKERGRDNRPVAGEYRDRLEKAERVLLAAKPYATVNPLWHERYIHVMGLLGRDKTEIVRAFLEAKEIERYYLPLYSETALGVSPVWSPDYRLLEQFANEAVELTRDREGAAVYARIYRTIDNKLDKEGALFKLTQASWPSLRGAFEDIISHYPGNPHDLHLFASYACQAGDGDKYLELRPRIPVATNRNDAWTTNYSMDVCDHMYLQRL